MSTINSFITKFKIPTLLGVGIIMVGITAGVYLNLKEQIFVSQAAPDQAPQNIILTNVTEDTVAISWQTKSAAPSFVTFGQNNPGEQTVLEDQDIGAPRPRFIHYASLKNLLPKTAYQFKVVSGKTTSETARFQTAQPSLTGQTGFTPIIGSVLDNNVPLINGVVYLSIADAITQSAPVKTGGNFLIPLSQIRKTDLSDYQLTEGTTAKLTIRSDKGEANILLKLTAASLPFPPIQIGQNLDLTVPEETPLPTPTTTDLGVYDLNGDGAINAADYAILLSCFGKRTSLMLSGKIACTTADLNEDKAINQTDLDLINQKFKDLGVPLVNPP